MNARQLRFKFALEPGTVGVYAGDAYRLACWPLRTDRMGPAHIRQQFSQMFFEPLGAAAHGCNIRIAASRASARHALCVATMMAAQGSIDLVKNPVGAAMRTFTFPVAVSAVQDRRVTATVQKHQTLLATRHPLCNRLQQRRGNHAFFWLMVHVDPAHHWQTGMLANAAGHLQANITATFCGRPAMVPGLQRRRGRSQKDFGALQPGPVDGQIARRIARPLLTLVAGVMLLVDDDQPERRQRSKNRHARTQHDASHAAVRRKPALQPLCRCHAAMQTNHSANAKQAVEAGPETRFELRREVDFRHHDQRLCMGVTAEQLLDDLQIDLGLAAAGGAKQQKRPGNSVELADHLLLLRSQGQSATGSTGLDGSRVCWLGVAFDPSRHLQRREFAQLRRQCGQGHFSQRALVIVRRESHQLPPRHGQGGNAFYLACNRTQLVR